MSKRADINELLRHASPDCRRRNQDMRDPDRDAWSRAAKPERHQRHPLEPAPPHKETLVDVPGPCLVRITRVGHRRYDHDNLSGGCKELRDAIAAALGKPGDSEEAGMHWEYAQRTGSPETIVEVFAAE